MNSTNPKKATNPKNALSLLVINQYFYPDISATSQIITELCVELSKHYEVKVLCGKPSYNPVEPLKEKLFAFYDFRGCKVKRVWNASYSRKTLQGRIFNYLTFMFFGCIEGLALKRVNIALAMTDPPFAGFISYLIRKLRGIPYIITLQDLHPDIEIITNLLPKNIFVKLWIRLNNIMFRNAEHVVVLGNKIREYLIHHYGLPPEKVVVIPNFSDDDNIHPQPRMNKFIMDKEFKNKFIIVHSGNMGLNQELPVIIEAGKLLKGNKELVFVMIGDGAMKAALVTMVEQYGLDNVYFLPYQKKEELSYSLSAADIHIVTLQQGLSNFIVPSKTYGIMAAGKPIIACIDADSDVAGMVREAQCGIVIEPGDPKKLADAIQQLFNGREKLVELGNNARRYLDKKLRKAYVIEAYRKLLSDYKERDEEIGR